MMLYQEFAPPPDLAALVDCFWASHAAPMGAPLVHQVLPDNCMDILWQDRTPGGFVSGMMTTAFDVTVLAPVETVAVRFRPGVAAQVFGLPLDQLTDLHVDLADLWGRAACAELAERLWARPLDLAARLAILRVAVAERCRAVRPQALVLHALAAIEASGGALRVEALAAGLGVSRQHLARQFREQVGLTAKAFARVCRFRQARAALRPGVAPDWAAIAAETGYFDQSHLIHDFRALTGRAPGSFLA